MVQAGEIYKSIDADGKVVYSDHLDPSMSQSSLVQLEDPRFPPSQLHFCWTNCFTLILDNGVYRRADGTDESWTVETFSANAIVLHRHDAPADWNGYSRRCGLCGTGVQRPADRRHGQWETHQRDRRLLGHGAQYSAGQQCRARRKPTANLDSASSASVSSAAPPPPLPEEDQPTLPEDGSLWTPGYWYWRDQGYFWIPGAWVRDRPRWAFYGLPPYWGFAGTVFVFHPGHWGSTVGFYGGVNYGYGYFGNGYTGGHWIGNSFAYNSAVNHVDPAVAHHTYAESVPGQASRGVLSYSARPRNGDSARTASAHRSPAGAVNRRHRGVPSTELAKQHRCHESREVGGRRLKRRLPSLLRNPLKSLRAEQRRSNNDRI
jgi:hypothetical protein